MRVENNNVSGQNLDPEQIDLIDLLVQLWRGKMTIIISVIVAIALAIGYLVVAKEKWTSTAIVTQPDVGQIAGYNNAINVIYGSAAPKVSEIQSILIGRFSTTFSALAETLDNQEEPEKLTIEPTVKNQSLPLAVSYVGQSPEAAQKQLAQYIQQVDDQVNEELEKDLKDNIALRMKNLQDSLKTQEVVAQEQKELRIRQIQEALQYANQAAVNAADNGSDFINIPHDIFCECPDESVDYAVMEKTADAVVVGLDADWSDVGSWSALWEVSPKDEQGNVLSGDAWVHNSENCYINSDEKLVAAIGVENLVIVSTKDAVLVMNRERSQDVKKAVEFLKQNQRSEYKRHREIYRPWGRCDVVVQTPRFNVNRITVKPGGAFSMQMHHHRAEHWVILAGTGQVTVNGKQFLLSENQSTFIPIGAEHCLENPGCIPLEVLEIQSGAYLGEDDIIRIKDQYGRC
ncbi:mannose-1-phosphate guanylyltransferase/mannose-6-phosphate isomerase [Escherichia coli]|nr:mannose-1-phosphate guanylyltransferase/mannose-6-phosphate isomerase [Escherichia coli]